MLLSFNNRSHCMGLFLKYFQRLKSHYRSASRTFLSMMRVLQSTSWQSKSKTCLISFSKMCFYLSLFMLALNIFSYLDVFYHYTTILMLPILYVFSQVLVWKQRERQCVGGVWRDGRWEENEYSFLSAKNIGELYNWIRINLNLHIKMMKADFGSCRF